MQRFAPLVPPERPASVNQKAGPPSAASGRNRDMEPGRRTRGTGGQGDNGSDGASDDDIDLAGELGPDREWRRNAHGKRNSTVELGPGQDANAPALAYNPFGDGPLLPASHVTGMMAAQPSMQGTPSLAHIYEPPDAVRPGDRPRILGIQKARVANAISGSKPVL